MARVLATAKIKGSAMVLAPAVKALETRGHEVDVFATGAEDEAIGFGDVDFTSVGLCEGDYGEAVKGYDAVLVGMSGFETPDGHFLRAANGLKVPTIAVQDQNRKYGLRLGNDKANLPTLIALMSEECIDTMVGELPEDMGREAVRRSRVVGWTAFDNYAKLRDGFTSGDREDFLERLSLKAPVYSHFTQNMHPDAEYHIGSGRSEEENRETFEYETAVAEAVFREASDLGLQLAVKPHPGEKFEVNSTLELAEAYGHVYLPAKSCDTKELMLVSDSVTAGRSTCLTEGCLLGRNTGGILPDVDEEWIVALPSVALDAIPYTKHWDGITGVLNVVSSDDLAVQESLAGLRQRFSVDGGASERLADLVEGVL